MIIVGRSDQLSVFLEVCATRGARLKTWGTKTHPPPATLGSVARGEGERNDANERHGKGLAVFTNGDK